MTNHRYEGTEALVAAVPRGDPGAADRLRRFLDEHALDPGATSAARQPSSCSRPRRYPRPYNAKAGPTGDGHPLHTPDPPGKKRLACFGSRWK
jgi:hypothetical protein